MHNLLFCPHTLCMSYVTNVSISSIVPQYGVNNYFVLCTLKAQKGNKNLQQRTFVGFHNHSPPLTMEKLRYSNERSTEFESLYLE